MKNDDECQKIDNILTKVNFQIWVPIRPYFFWPIPLKSDFQKCSAYQENIARVRAVLISHYQTLFLPFGFFVCKELYQYCLGCLVICSVRVPPFQQGLLKKSMINNQFLREICRNVKVCIYEIGGPDKSDRLPMKLSHSWPVWLEYPSWKQLKAVVTPGRKFVTGEGRGLRADAKLCLSSWVNFLPHPFTQQIISSTSITICSSSYLLAKARIKWRNCNVFLV